MTTVLHCVTTSSACLSMSDWKDLASILGTLVAVPGVLFAAYKTWREVQRSREQRASELEQREREHQLRRAEFTLSQHRRLFDDPALSSVMKILDGDNPDLREVSMWEPKRKFLTFFEELILLVNSGYIAKETALYMFGYYATCAHKGVNFRVGIDYLPKYWSLFMGFAEEAEQYLDSPVAKDVRALRL
jgi:hypothetical protein